MTLGHWLAIVATVTAIALGLFTALFQHYRRAVEQDDARDRYIKRLTSQPWSDGYFDRLDRALRWLNLPFGSPWGLRGLGLCVTISLAYCYAVLMLGWTLGGPWTLGDLGVFGPSEMPPRILAWPIRAFSALVGYVLPVAAFYFFRAALRWGWRFAARISRLPGLWSDGAKERVERLVFWLVFLMYYFVTFAVVTAGVVVTVEAGVSAVAEPLVLGLSEPLAESEALAGIAAVGVMLAGFLASGLVELRFALHFGPVATGVAVLTGVAFSVGLVPTQSAIMMLLFFFVLPFVNGACDWVSLSVSRRFGARIVAVRGAAWPLVLAVADFAVAGLLLFAVTALLAGGVEALGLLLGVRLNVEKYVWDAAAAPWTVGFWATFMVLSTLLPTAAHFAIALAAMLLGWERLPLRVRASRRLESANQADHLFPALYMACWWMPALALVVAVFWGLALGFGAIGEPLPDALAWVAHRAIVFVDTVFGHMLTSTPAAFPSYP